MGEKRLAGAGFHQKYLILPSVAPEPPDDSARTDNIAFLPRGVMLLC